MCQRLGINRMTRDKWLRCFCGDGSSGLGNRSRKPRSRPRRTSAEMESLVLTVREARRVWGGRKIPHHLLCLGHKGEPSARTITEILRRHDKLEPQDGRQIGPYQRFERECPNELWQMDHKGHFPMGAERCHPLTVIDDHARFALCLAT